MLNCCYNLSSYFSVNIVLVCIKIHLFYIHSIDIGNNYCINMIFCTERSKAYDVIAHFLTRNYLHMIYIKCNDSNTHCA